MLKSALFTGVPFSDIPVCELLAAAFAALRGTTMTQHTWYTKQGTVKALRKSADAVWPLRDAYGRTYAKKAELGDLVAKAHAGELVK